jgi:hypothetical protein
LRQDRRRVLPTVEDEHDRTGTAGTLAIGRWFDRGTAPRERACVGLNSCGDLGRATMASAEGETLDVGRSDSGPTATRDDCSFAESPVEGGAVRRLLLVAERD